MKNLKNYLFIFICALTLNSVKSQVSEKYDSLTIYLQSGGYVKDGKKYHIGFFGEKLKKEMVVSAEAMNIYEKFQRQHRRDLILVWAFFGAEIAGVLVNDTGLKKGLVFGGLVLPFVAIPFSKNAGNNFQKAIWIRNRDVLK